jgi:hypothetical protein
MDHQKTEGESARPARSGINYWRNVRYMDDGVTCYQCLLCKEQWHAAEFPGYTGGDGIYKRSWKFCPFCATQWVGYKLLGDRRAKVNKLIEAYEISLWDRPRAKKRGWVIEYSSEHTHGWQSYQKVRGNYLDAYRVLKDIRAEEEGDYLNFPFKYKQLYRARIVDL